MSLQTAMPIIRRAVTPAKPAGQIFQLLANLKVFRRTARPLCYYATVFE
jgi:hypothetical protein